MLNTNFKSHGQTHLGLYTIDIEKTLFGGGWSVGLFKNIGEQSEEVLDARDEIKTKAQAIKIGKLMLDKVKLELVYNR